MQTVVHLLLKFVRDWNNGEAQDTWYGGRTIHILCGTISKHGDRLKLGRLAATTIQSFLKLAGTNS